MLGGSSGLNLLAWARPSKPELDAWDVFAPNAGWTWDDLLPYFKKTEAVYEASNQFINPFVTQQNAQQRFDKNLQGFVGPVKVSSPDIPHVYICLLTHVL